MAIIESGNSGEFHYDSEPINPLLKMLQGVAQQDNACLRRSKAGGRKKLTVADSQRVSELGPRVLATSATMAGHLLPLA